MTDGDRENGLGVIRSVCDTENNSSTKRELKSITVDAVIANVAKVTDFVNEELDRLGCSMKAQMQIDVAIDELFGNIANYAYHPEVGKATVEIRSEKCTAEAGDPEEVTQVLITFTDHGVPYNPLEKEDPDVTLSADKRQIGGLGIFLVKKTMDDIEYEYKDGKNILTIKKSI